MSPLHATGLSFIVALDTAREHNRSEEVGHSWVRTTNHSLRDHLRPSHYPSRNGGGGVCTRCLNSGSMVTRILRTTTSRSTTPLRTRRTRAKVFPPSPRRSAPTAKSTTLTRGTKVWHECNTLKNDKDKKQKNKDGKKDKGSAEVGKRATEAKQADDTEAPCCRSSSHSLYLWNFDTGASSHMTNNIGLLINTNHCHGSIKMENAVKIPFYGKRTVEVSVSRQMLPRRIYCNLHRW
jgi:hypothetical protein